MTTNGYDIVNIIQMSIILIYPVIGRDWDIPMKLKQKDFKTHFTTSCPIAVKKLTTTYYVVNTKSKVALTSMTISR